MTCAELEIVLADYLDQAVAAGEKSAIEAHLATCSGCAELARDAGAAVAFMERAAVVDPPPGMVARICTSPMVEKRSWTARLFGFVLQPRMAMGVAMAVLSIAMLQRMWAPAENEVYRAWDRTVKQYESLPLVSAIQAQLDDWTQDAGLNGAQDQ